MHIFLRLICLLLLVVPEVRAQERLSLGSAIVTGLRNNFGVRIAENEYEAARNNNTAGNAGRLPRLDITAEYTRSLNDVSMKVSTGGGLDRTDAPSELINACATLRWTVFDGLNMFITRDKLRELESAGGVAARIAAENVTADIVDTYCDVIRQTRVLAIIMDRVDVSRFRAGIAGTAFETGAGSELEMLRAQVDLNTDLADLETQRVVLATTKARLNEILARDPGIDFAPDDSIMLLPKLDFDMLVRDTREWNRDLILARHRRAIDSLETGRIKAQLWPTLNLQASYGFLRNETEAAFITFNRLNGPSVGVTASWNLFNGFNDARRIENARIDVMNDDLRIRDLDVRLRIALDRVYGEYVNQLQQIGYERTNLELARKSMDIAKESFAVGNSSSLELREVQKNLTEAGTRLIAAQYLAKVKETELMRLAGRLVQPG